MKDARQAYIDEMLEGMPPSEANLASNMTTRQAFAMAAMQGILSNPFLMQRIVIGRPKCDYDWSMSKVKLLADCQANLMLKEES